MINNSKRKYITPYIAASSNNFIFNEDGSVQKGVQKTRNDFDCFCVSYWIGTHAATPSAYMQEQYETYDEVYEVWNKLSEDDQRYLPILGVDEDGNGWYFDGSFGYKTVE